MKKVRKKFSFFALLLAMLIGLCSCSIEIESGPNFSNVQGMMQVTQSPAFHSGGQTQMEVLRVGEDVYYELERLYPDAQLFPIAMFDSRQGLAFQSDDRSRLLLCDYLSGRQQDFIVCDEAAASIGEEIALSDSWLVWTEKSLLRQEDDVWRSQVVLKAWEYRREGAEPLRLDSGYVSGAEGFFLPFDSLSLDGHELVYRRSTFWGGRRDTEVCFIDLHQLQTQVLAQASEANGKMILRCSIGDRLIAWDEQVGYQYEIPGLQPLDKARYNLYIYHMDSSKLEARQEPLQQISLNRGYFWPLVYRDNLIAVEQLELDLNNLYYESVLVQINLDMELISLLTPPSTHSEDLLFFYGWGERYEDKGTWRLISRHRPHMGRKLLSWQSNIAEHHVVIDMESMRYIALPVYDSAGAGATQYAYHDFISLEQYQVRPLWGLDADYLYFRHVDEQQDAYILRVE